MFLAFQTWCSGNPPSSRYHKSKSQHLTDWCTSQRCRCSSLETGIEGCSRICPPAQCQLGLQRTRMLGTEQSCWRKGHWLHIHLRFREEEQRLDREWGRFRWRLLRRLRRANMAIHRKEDSLRANLRTGANSSTLNMSASDIRVTFPFTHGCAPV